MKDNHIDYQVGDHLPSLVVKVDRDDLRRYAHASKDFNPIHQDDDAAKKAGLDGVVAHGMWTMGAAIRIVTENMPQIRICGYRVRFARPVYVPSDRAAVLCVDADIAHRDANRMTLNLVVTCEEKKVLTAARVEVEVL